MRVLLNINEKKKCDNKFDTNGNTFLDWHTNKNIIKIKIMICITIDIKILFFVLNIIEINILMHADDPEYYILVRHIVPLVGPVLEQVRQDGLVATRNLSRRKYWNVLLNNCKITAEITKFERTQRNHKIQMKKTPLLGSKVGEWMAGEGEIGL